MTATSTRPSTHAEINVFRRQALIDATVQSIHEFGFAATTVETICRAAGVSRGLIRHYFSTKTELMIATYRYLRDELQAEIHAEMERVSGGGFEKLCAMVRPMFLSSAFEDRRISAWLAFSEAAQTVQPLRAVNRDIYESFRRDATSLFEEAAQETERSVDAERAAKALIALTDGLWLEYRLDSSAFTREEAMAICFEYIEWTLGLDSASRKEHA